MASLVEELILTLEQEYDIYSDLIPLVQKKTRVIVDNDLKILQEITEQEQFVIDQVTALENQRQKVVANIEIVMGQKAGSLDLKAVIKMLEQQPDEQRKLSILYDNLNHTIHRLMEINNHNRSLIEQSLEMVEFNMNFIQSTRMLPGNNYTKNASRIDAQVNQTGMFDAKQ